MIEIRNKAVRSSDGKYVHRRGSDIYYRVATVLPGDTEDDFEEVDAVPAYTVGEYETKVAELVRERYRADEEFALQRKMLNLMLHPEAADADTGSGSAGLLGEFTAYNGYVEQCKLRAREILEEEKG